MKTLLLVIGKTDEEYLEYGIKKYSDRIGHYAPFEMKVLPDVRRNKVSQDQQKTLEGQMLIKELQPGDVVVLLDENGVEMTSRQFAEFYTKTSVSGAKRLVIIIGGPYGFSQEVYDRVKNKISLSRMTFSHQMVRLVFIEQLYRAHTIIKGEPYHHD